MTNGFRFPRTDSEHWLNVLNWTYLRLPSPIYRIPIVGKASIFIHVRAKTTGQIDIGQNQNESSWVRIMTSGFKFPLLQAAVKFRIGLRVSVGLTSLTGPISNFHLPYLPLRSKTSISARIHAGIGASAGNHKVPQRSK
jgi:hypothetical protein